MESAQTTILDAADSAAGQEPSAPTGDRAAGGSARRSSLASARAVKARPPLSIDFKAVNRAALENLPSVLARLAPGGEHRGNQYAMLNPHREDRRLGSFCVNIATGRWADFATGDRGGDVVSLVAFLFRLSQVDAARNLARMLEIEDGVASNG